MPDPNSIINFGDLSKPANTLIEKISDAVGGVMKPWQIKRVTKAEAESEKIKALSKIEITELEQRAFKRFLGEEEQKQKNIESIAAQSLPLLLEEAKPENMEKDWITNFFDKCRLVSDEEMQKAWAKILAGEANAPGTFSKRTINFMASLDKQDAVLFTKLCGFNWIISGVYPLIYDLKAKIYTNNGITFGVLKHLDAIGLVSFENLAGYIRQGLPQTIIAIYKNTPYTLKFQKEKDNTLQIGCVLLTIVGEELSTICASDTIAEFDEYIIQEWGKEGIIVSPSTPLH